MAEVASTSLNTLECVKRQLKFEHKHKNSSYLFIIYHDSKTVPALFVIFHAYPIRQ